MKFDAVIENVVPIFSQRKQYERFKCDYTSKKISDETGLSEKTVKETLQRGFHNISSHNIIASEITAVGRIPTAVIS